jgi:Tol biopolymer transport system component
MPLPVAPPPAPPPPLAPPADSRRLPWLLLAGLGCVVLLLGALALAGGGALGFMLSRSTATAAPAPTRAATAASPALPTSPPAHPTAAPTHTPAAVTATPSPIVSGPSATSPATNTAPPKLTPTRPATSVPAGTPLGSGGRIAFISNRDGQFFQVYTMNPDGSDVRQVTTDETNKWDPKWPFNGTQLAWSPDGQQLLYVAESAAGNGTDLFAVGADGANAVDVTNAAGDDFQPTWCSDGSIWFTSTRINGVHQIFHTDLKSVAQGLKPINFSATHKSPREYDVTLYPGCQRAVFVTTLDGPPELWLYWPDCPACYRMLRSAKDQGGKTEEPALSPDNVYLAYTLALPGSSEVVVGKLADRTVDVQLTNTQGNSEPQWSPDGQWLVFVSTRDGNREIYRMNLAGTSQINLSNNPATDTDPVWR